MYCLNNLFRDLFLMWPETCLKETLVKIKIDFNILFLLVFNKVTVLLLLYYYSIILESLHLFFNNLKKKYVCISERLCYLK